MDRHRILLIEDHQIYRETVGKTLESAENYDCVGQFSNLEDAFEAVSDGLEADIVLLDLGLPTMDGIDGIGHLRELLPEAKVIILTAFTDRSRVFAALEAGAHGYLVKAGSTKRLLESMDEVINGGTPLDSQIAGMVLSTFQKLSPIAEEEKLAPREKQILQLVAKGLTKQQVADELEISPHSVSGYLRRAFDKLHVHSLPAAVSAAIRRGLLDLS
ncbi:response regulator [Haloferula sp.]|uniref:response regulator n=1 Tax=Haloferula sp. TaxID=2497595 RepID=UPI003C74C752